MEGRYLPDLGRHGEEMEKLENKVEKEKGRRVECLHQDETGKGRLAVKNMPSCAGGQLKKCWTANTFGVRLCQSKLGEDWSVQ